MWAPLGYATTDSFACRSCQHLKALGTLRAGVPVDAAVAELDAIRSELVRAYPAEYGRGAVAVIPLREKLANPVRGGLLILLAGDTLVLLVACANVANLHLARGLHRSRERFRSMPCCRWLPLRSRAWRRCRSAPRCSLSPPHFH
jgi:hypothetical protein